MSEDFGAWLEDELLRRGWSQRELGRRAGLSQTAISWVIAGRRKPTPNFCLLIAPPLEIPTAEVLRRAGRLPAPPELDALGPRVRHRWEEIVRKMGRFDEREQKLLTDELSNLVDLALALKGGEAPEGRPETR